MPYSHLPDITSAEGKTVIHSHIALVLISSCACDFDPSESMFASDMFLVFHHVHHINLCVLCLQRLCEGSSQSPLVFLLPALVGAKQVHGGYDSGFMINIGSCV